MRAYSLSSRLIENYLRQPYTWFLNRNSAQLSTTILIEVNRVVDQAIMPAMRLISQGAVVLLLFGAAGRGGAGRRWCSPCCSAAATCWSTSGCATRLGRIGEARLEANHQRFKAADDAVAASRT